MNSGNTASGPIHQGKPNQKNFTDEQRVIINTEGDVKVNAVAGSGKTTTIIEYAASRPQNSRILYLAFNKTVKTEAIRRFRERGLHNVTVETAHSLAYRYIVKGTGYAVKGPGYKTHEIVELLGLTGNGEKHAEYIIANHINKFITWFCNSDRLKVQDLNYNDTINDNKAKAFVRTFYKYIEDGTRWLLAKMDNKEIEITHDFYLKKFQLSNPVLPYDYILFDEGQDASAAMLDVFLKQKATKVIVGDTHQQIYAWRHAVNSMDKTDFITLRLSSSFRFAQPVANLAMEVLKWKNHLYECTPVRITGQGTVFREQSKATLARTNLGLLLKAIGYVTENKKTKHIYFEGNISSYTYADDGTSLYDVLNLYNHNRHRIRDKLIQSMKDFDELEEYIDKTEDLQLGMMAEIVKEYGNEIPRIIKLLKELHTGDDDREKAEMIFSTVHRAKGMEYDVVHLVNDFISETKLEKLIEKHKADKEYPLNISKLNEEINLLYVAITRTKNKLYIPGTLMPKEFPASPHIQVVKVETEEDDMDDYLPEYEAFLINQSRGSKKIINKTEPGKAYSFEQKRELYKDAYRPWTPDLDKELEELFTGGTSVNQMAEHFKRTKGAIQSRLKKLNYFSD